MRPAARGLLALVVLFGAVAPLAGAVAAADTPVFDENVMRTTQGEVTEIAITVPDGTAEPMIVEIGSEKVNFRVNATVVDADGDGAVVLQFDTAGAGRKPADSYLSVRGGDELASAEQSSHEFDPDQLLAQGDYDLALWYDGETVDVGTLIVEARQTTRSGDAAEIDIVYQGEQLTLAAAEGQVVRGETTLDAGTSVTVRMRSSGANPFLKSVETTVTEQGTFEATFDMSDVPEGSYFELSVRGNGSGLASAEGRVACENGCPTIAPTPTQTSTVTHSSTSFPSTTTEPSDDGLLGSLGPLGAMALGAVLAVLGVGILLGVFRS